MATDKRIDPFRGFNFRLEIDGLPVAGFSEVSGLTVDRDATDYREGTDRTNIVRKLPALSKVVALVCIRGYTQDDTLWQWYERIARGVDDRRDGSVVLMNEAHKDVMRWNFVNGFVTKLEGPALKASDNAVAVERMEIIHEQLTMELEPAPAPVT
jgi:phage tail-like protein